MKKFTFLGVLTVLFLSSFGQNAWINEIHYDNSGGDVNEMVEVVIENPGTYVLSDFAVYTYNGSNGATYGNNDVSTFTVGSTDGNFTFYYIIYPANGLQNGSPDGLALTYQGALIPGQFLTYEGTLTATDGPANGVLSTDIGVEETGSANVGESLQLTGSGSSYSDFTWVTPATETPGNLNNGQTFGAPAPVAAPTFDPAAGSFYTAQDVSMATTTAGADIYYTLDGTTIPDNTSLDYSVTGPVNIAATTTIIAVAYDGANYSSTTTGTFTIEPVVQVADLATLRAQADDNTTVYELTGEALLTYQQSYRNKKYIQDATAAIEIDDPSGTITTTYNIGDGISGILGKLNTYNGILQFIPIMDPGAASSTGNTITPLVISADEFNNNHEMYECRLVKIDNLTFADAGGTFSTGSNYTTTDHLGTDVLFRTNFYGASYIGTTIPSGAQDIVGIVYEFNGTPQFTARETTDIVPHVPVIPVGSTGIIIAGLLMAAVIVARRGKLF